MDDAGPTEGPEQKHQTLDLSDSRFERFVRAFPHDDKKTSLRCTLCHPTEVSDGSAIEAKRYRLMAHLDSKKHKVNVEKAEGMIMAGAGQSMASELVPNLCLTCT